MRILITGCAGYIGSVLTQNLLFDGHEVVGVDNLMFGQHFVANRLRRYSNFRLLHEDVKNKHWLNEAKRADAIIHLAAWVGAPLCNKHTDRQVWHNNTEPVKELVKVLSKDQLLIYPNTNSGYGIADKESVCTEESPINPISSYGVTKYEGELFALEHPNSVVFRLATVFGMSPRMRFDLMVNDFTYRAYVEKVIEVFEPNFRRNFVHINDVVGAFIKTLESKTIQQGRVFNLGNDADNMTKGELATLVCNRTGAKVSYREGNDPDKRDYNVSSEKLRKAGFEAQFTVEHGIRNIIMYFEMLSLNDIIKDAKEQRNV